MILTPKMLLTLATLCADDYQPSPAGTVIDAGNDIRAVLEPTPEYLAVSIRGTVVKDLDNWETDFDAIPSFHVMTGWAPRGFQSAALRLLPLLGPYLIGRRVIIGGHSLGGAVGAQIACMLVRSGRSPVAYALFEPARSCSDFAVEALAGVEGYVCRFGDDPVPLLPPLYRHPRAVTAIGHATLDPLDCHSISGVVDWLREAAREPVAA